MAQMKTEALIDAQMRAQRKANSDALIAALTETVMPLAKRVEALEREVAQLKALEELRRDLQSDGLRDEVITTRDDDEATDDQAAEGEGRSADAQDQGREGEDDAEGDEAPASGEVKPREGEVR